MYKTHITAASASLSKNSQNLLAIIESVNNTGGQILEDWISKELCVKHTKHRSKEEVLSRANKAIDRSDFIIAECSFPSNSVGINVERAIFQKIPILCLYLSGKEKNVGSLIQASHSDLIIIRKYSADTALITLQGFLKELFSEKKPKRIKYSIFLNPKQAKYLEWLAGEYKLQNSSKRSFKSEILRKIIDNTLKKDKDYKLPSS